MTVPETTTRECIPDLDPPDRRRSIDEPAFLKPLPSGDYVSCLITILSNIPGSREALLFRTKVLHDYGYDPNWWREATSTLPAMTNGRDEPQFEVIAETQRIMAFLDRTNRSYGSVETLATLEYQEDDEIADLNPKTNADKFLIGWTSAARRAGGPASLIKMFRSSASKSSPDEKTPHGFWCLENILDNAATDLYDMIDDALWMVDPTGENDVDACIEQVAEVFVTRMVQPDSSATGLNFNIPTEWYADRYLPENVQATKAMRRERTKYQRKLAELEQKQKRLGVFRHPRTGKAYSSSGILRAVISHLEQHHPDQDPTNGASEVGDWSPVPSSSEPENADIAHELENVYENVSRELEGLYVVSGAEICRLTCTQH